jgi:hypothetical protein
VLVIPMVMMDSGTLNLSTDIGSTHEMKKARIR